MNRRAFAYLGALALGIPDRFKAHFGQDNVFMDVDGNNQIELRRQIVKREIIRVEPFDSNFEKWGVPVSTCTRAGDMIFVSGLPPFDPKTGELLVHAPFEQQAERCLEELKTALEAAGSDLEHVLKVNVLCVSPERFKAFNEIYKRYFPKNPPARIFFCVPVWTGPFDIEIECIAVRKD